MVNSEKANGVERREFPDKVALVACIDEDIDYGPNVIVFGMAGSGITKLGGGNQEVYPDKKRKLVEKVRLVVFSTLQEITSGFGVPLLATSHVGCGAANAQEIPAEEIIGVTEQMCEELKVDYLGHIPHAEEPVEVGNSNVTAHIGRKESDHHHGAFRVIVTVGGGITEEEIQAYESDGYGDAFVISADWLSRAIKSGKITEEEALEFIDLQVDIADGIADGVASYDSVRIWNAGRMESKEVLENMRLFNNLVAKHKSS